jgi:hypothetical protein
MIDSLRCLLIKNLLEIRIQMHINSKSQLTPEDRNEKILIVMQMRRKLKKQMERKQRMILIRSLQERETILMKTMMIIKIKTTSQS